jgi:hypothetical protein
VKTGPASKKSRILAVAQALGVKKFTPAEIEQVRRQLIARHGEAAKTSADYIASVLEDAGLRVVLRDAADTAEEYEEQFHDLLHFSTLAEAEMCLVRLDEMWRKFRAEGEPAAAARVLEVARRGRRRAEMIAHNAKVEQRKRAEKAEVANWFALWLQTPDLFFDWLEVRKQAPEFVQRFGAAGAEEET